MDVSGKVMNKVLEKGLGIYHRYGLFFTRQYCH